MPLHYKAIKKHRKHFIYIIRLIGLHRIIYVLYICRFQFEQSIRIHSVQINNDFTFLFGRRQHTHTYIHNIFSEYFQITSFRSTFTIFRIFSPGHGENIRKEIYTCIREKDILHSFTSCL